MRFVLIGTIFMFPLVTHVGRAMACDDDDDRDDEVQAVVDTAADRLEAQLDELDARLEALAGDDDGDVDDDE